MSTVKKESKEMEENYHNMIEENSEVKMVDVNNEDKEENTVPETSSPKERHRTKIKEENELQLSRFEPSIYKKIKQITFVAHLTAFWNFEMHAGNRIWIFVIK